MRELNAVESRLDEAQSGASAVKHHLAEAPGDERLQRLLQVL